MKQKIKEFSKKYLVGFIIGSILFGTLGVYAVTYFPGLNTTYDNSDSGMTSTNVQDALDELYGLCVPPAITVDQIIEQAGLTKDEYECRYFFTGTNPNNYITFNNETAKWRMLSVECDGRIKIIRVSDARNTNSLVWDTSGSNNWARPSTVNTYLNGTYYNTLNSIAQSQIVESNFSIGPVIVDNSNMLKQVTNENSIKWSGKIGLITVSEVIRTNSSSSCDTFYSNSNNWSTCDDTSWLNNNNPNNYWWTISPTSGTSQSVIYNVRGHTSKGANVKNSSYDLLPTLYLSSEVKITGGTGTQSDPYIIE